MSTDIVAYLYQLSQDKDPRYEALRQVLKAFDTGLFPMFLFSEEDIAHSQQHGDLPPDAQPLEIALRHAMLSSHTQGEFCPPWYIAQKLRVIADVLEKEAAAEFEHWLDNRRREGNDLPVSAAQERKLPEWEQRLEALYAMVQAVDAAREEPDQIEREDRLKAIVAAALDEGVSLPVIETDMAFWDMVDQLPRIFADEIERLKARIQRVRDLVGTDTSDPDGFAEDVDPAAPTERIHRSTKDATTRVQDQNPPAENEGDEQPLIG